VTNLARSSQSASFWLIRYKQSAVRYISADCESVVDSSEARTLSLGGCRKISFCHGVRAICSTAPRQDRKTHTQREDSCWVGEVRWALHQSFTKLIGVDWPRPLFVNAVTALQWRDTMTLVDVTRVSYGVWQLRWNEWNEWKCSDLKCIQKPRVGLV